MQEKRGRRSGNYRGERQVPAWKTVRNWLIVIAVAALLITGFNAIRNIGGETRIRVDALPCSASQNVAPFGECVLYYDGASIHCLNANGSEKWSYPIGAGAYFSASDRHLAIWSATELFIVDQNGRTSYNGSMDGTIQFARICDRYCAVVYGSDAEPNLSIKNLDGTQVDYEREAYSGMMLLDVGFYGEADQYLWTLAMDVYGVTINTVMNTFQVGKMSTNIVNLGKYLAYRVIYDSGNLRVFTTQQMYTYDYKGVQNMSGTELVYGWQVIDADMPERGNTSILMARTSQLNSTAGMSDLRLMNGASDRIFFLPARSVGAAIQRGNLYAFSSADGVCQLHHTTTGNQRFTTLQIPLLEGRHMTELLGLTTGGRAIIACGEEVYTVTLPR